jgi:hypothetical protein
MRSCTLSRPAALAKASALTDDAAQDEILSDEHVARTLWAAETMELLGVLRDHLYARSLDDSGTTTETPAYIREMLDAAKIRMLAVYTASGSCGAVMPTEIDAAWQILESHLLGKPEADTSANEAIGQLIELVEEESATAVVVGHRYSPEPLDDLYASDDE